MAYLNNLKIRTKLLLAFSTILIFTIIVGLNGLSTARNIQSSFENFILIAFSLI